MRHSCPERRSGRAQEHTHSHLERQSLQGHRIKPQVHPLWRGEKRRVVKPSVRYVVKLLGDPVFQVRVCFYLTLLALARSKSPEPGRSLYLLCQCIVQSHLGALSFYNVHVSLNLITCKSLNCRAIY